MSSDGNTVTSGKTDRTGGVDSIPSIDDEEVNYNGDDDEESDGDEGGMEREPEIVE